MQILEVRQKQQHSVWSIVRVLIILEVAGGRQWRKRNDYEVCTCKDCYDEWVALLVAGAESFRWMGMHVSDEKMELGSFPKAKAYFINWPTTYFINFALVKLNRVYDYGYLWIQDRCACIRTTKREVGQGGEKRRQRIACTQSVVTFARKKKKALVDWIHAPFN